MTVEPSLADELAAMKWRISNYNVTTEAHCGLGIYTETFSYHSSIKKRVLSWPSTGGTYKVVVLNGNWVWLPYNHNKLQRVYNSYHPHGTLIIHASGSGLPVSLPACVVDGPSLECNWILFGLVSRTLLELSSPPDLQLDLFVTRIAALLSSWSPARCCCNT